MQHRYTGDMGDFGKFLLLKTLFPHERIATIWYLYPDESHNNDGRHIVCSSNQPLYEQCEALDPLMSRQFNAIHACQKRHVSQFERWPVLDNAAFFSESIIGSGQDYREAWLRRAVRFIEEGAHDVVCLDPDNGLEPPSLRHANAIKRGKYTTHEEIEQFFALPSVVHCVIYQHFHRRSSHQAQMQEALKSFRSRYQERATVRIIRHNPVQARFYIVLSKEEIVTQELMRLTQLMYGKKPFFSVADVPIL